jgi:hypothetical protein
MSRGKEMGDCGDSDEMGRGTAINQANQDTGVEKVRDRQS